METQVPQEVMNIESNTTKNRKIYTGAAARIMKLLGNGVLQREAARAIGVSESLVSQYLAEPDFKEQVNEIVAKTFTEQSDIDRTYLEVEKTLAERLKKVTEFMFDPDKVIRTLKFVNEAKRKVGSSNNGSSGNSGGNGTTVIQPVILILPSRVASEYILNPNNEVIGVDGKDLTTFQSAQMNELAGISAKETFIPLDREKPILKPVPKPVKQLRVINNGPRSEDPWGNL